jgi:hypothetical protein
MEMQDWREIAAKVAVETDQERLMMLVAELCQVLDERKPWQRPRPQQQSPQS